MDDGQIKARQTCKKEAKADQSGLFTAAGTDSKKEQEVSIDEVQP